MPRPIEPAAPIFKEGAAFSETYGDTYWSLDGGLDETRHVFLSGNELPARWLARERFTLLETGFGTGLNFLCAWQRFRETAPSGARLHYLSVDKHPFRQEDLQRLYSQWPQLAPLGAALLDRYPPLIPGFHRLHLDGGRITLTLLWGEAAEMLAQLEHDPLARALLVATSKSVLQETAKALQEMTASAPRRSTVEASSRSGAVFLLARDVREAVAFSNAYAPEHLVLDVSSPKAALKKVKSAGSVFLGRHSSVAFGDYCAGPNHILPTMGRASVRSSLSTYDFLKVIPYQELTRAGASSLAPATELMATAEGLPGHARAASMRLAQVMSLHSSGGEGHTSNTARGLAASWSALPATVANSSCMMA